MAGPKTNAALAAYFNTGDQPSESNFGDLIDTIQPSNAIISETSGTKALTIADHAFRNIIVGDLSGHLTLTLPTTFSHETTSANYAWFHIIYFGPMTGDDDYNLLVKVGTENTHEFSGTIIHHSTANDTSGAALNAAVSATGNNDVLTFTTGNHANIWIHAKSTETWYIWGNSISNAVGDMAIDD